MSRDVQFNESVYPMKIKPVDVSDDDKDEDDIHHDLYTDDDVMMMVTLQ